MNKLLITIFFFALFYLTSAQSKTSNDYLIALDSTVKILESGDFENSLKSFNQILKDATEANNYEIIVVSTLNIGILYYRLNDNEKALNLYFKALDLSKKHNLEKHYNAIYNNIGIIYSFNNNYQKAKENFTEALNISKKLKDSIRIGINYINLSNLSNDFNDYDQAHKNIIEAEKIFNLIDNKAFLPPLYSLKGNIFYKEHRYKYAKINQQKALELLKNRNDKLYESDFNIELGRAFIELNQFDSAKIHLETGLEIATNIKNKESIIKSSRLLAQVYVQTNNAKKAIHHFVNCLNWKDSLLMEKSHKWVSESQMRYEFGKKEQEITFLERKNKLYLIIGILVVLIVISSGFLIIYTLRNRNIKTKQRNQLLVKEKELNVLELQKSEAENKCLVEEMKANEEISLMKQEKLQQEIEHKNRELASNALHVVSKNTILTDIQNMIKNIECENGQLNENKIRNISRLIDSNINLDNDWETFKIHFEEVHGDFFNRIYDDHQELSQTDMRLCAYLLINLNPKEIAQILNISPDSVRKRKQRLREKLDLNKETDLMDYLNKYKS